MFVTPFNKIKKNLTGFIPPKSLEIVPDKWEKIGDVLIIKLPKELNKYKEKIGEIYSDVLNCKTVLNDIGGITGEYRETNVKIIYGSSDTETIHKENNVYFKLNPQRIMFSSGNMDERIRMSKISNKNEIVVDLFAGIGYFTLPMAVYSKPEKIYACEKNPVAFDYLCQNIVLNNVSDIVEPLRGDNRVVAPNGVADRVLLGYIGDTHNFLSTAINCLKNNQGFIHYHDTFSDDIIPDDALRHLHSIVKKYDKKAKLLKFKKVKSYAPGVSHFVFDIKIG